MSAPASSHLPKPLSAAQSPPAAETAYSGSPGLAVLRSLVCGFLRRSDGLCCPSVAAIQEKTGLSRSTIFEALNRLEAAGIVQRTGRLVRRLVNFGGLARLTTVQTSNLYTFSEPSPSAHLLPIKRRIRNDAARLVAKLAKAFSFRAESGAHTGNHLRGFQEEGSASEPGFSSLRVGGGACGTCLRVSPEPRHGR